MSSTANESTVGRLGLHCVVIFWAVYGRRGGQCCHFRSPPFRAHPEKHYGQQNPADRTSTVCSTPFSFCSLSQGVAVSTRIHLPRRSFGLCCLLHFLPFLLFTHEQRPDHHHKQPALTFSPLLIRLLYLRTYTMGGPSWLKYGVPTLDRPFGLELWPIFEAAFEPVVGYKPQDFKFVPGETPMSTLKHCAIALFTYYVVIFGGRELMRERAPFKLNFLFKVHNFYLTTISGVLLALFAEQLIPILARKGLFFAICDHEGGWTDKLVILYYLNYLTKFLELIDTCFLFLKKKPLSTFLTPFLDQI